MEAEGAESDVSQQQKPKKIKKKTMKEVEPGIIYLSRIPTLMSVKKLRQILETYGEIGRVFLQPDERAATKKKKSRQFSEGWIEFMDKKVAKMVASTLNTTTIGGKRKNPWYEEIWNMKYLPKFKWGHLNERLAYERAVHQQRLRTEVAQAKRETNFYIQNMEKKKFIQRKEKKLKEEVETREWNFVQKDTEDEVLARKRKRKGEEEGKAKRRKEQAPHTSQKKAGMNANFLQTLFSGGNKDGEGSS